MKQEQKEIAYVLSDMGMDVQLIEVITTYSIHRDEMKSQKNRE